MLRHMPRKAFYRGFATTATSLKPFTISFIIPDGRNQLETETYSSGKEFRLAFPGFRFVDPKTNVAISATSIPDKVDPTVTYLAKHPFFVAPLEGYSHQQVSDKAFEEKSCAALEYHLRKSHMIQRRPPHNPSQVDGWRFLGGDKDVAEWEGIWEGVDGHVYFLEAKHSVDMASFTFMTLDSVWVSHMLI
jgi:hypothetical protein